jgi:hypothetical protein
VRIVFRRGSTLRLKGQFLDLSASPIHGSAAVENKLKYPGKSYPGYQNGFIG